MKRRPNRIIIGFVSLGIILVLLNAIGALRPIKLVAGAITSPFQHSSTGSGRSLGNFFHILGSVRQLAADNQRLSDENAALRQQVVQDKEIRAQNDQLRKQLNFTAIDPGRLVGAEVVSYQPDNFRQFVTINRGSKDGVSSGMAVISQGSLVGTISDVTPHSSKVFLLIDPNFRVSALDQDQADRPNGTVQGQIGGGLQMQKIAQNETVRSGDTIVTSGLGDLVPKGIQIGRVETVDSKADGVFQTAQLTSDLQFTRLEIVYVVVK